MSRMGKPVSAAESWTGREPHPLTGTALTFDLAGEAEALKREPTWEQSGHNAKTLIKHADVRVVLIALRKGARMQEHKTDQCVTLHALAGHLRVHVPGNAVDLPMGALMALDHTVVHDVEALEESVLLLTLGWSKQPRPHAKAER
jgi:quercetin dioxygenase-like cupin family protein